jgi:hypothetical protein
MCVDLSGGDTFMPKHFLYGAEIGAAFYKMRGERVAESMGRHMFCNAGLSRKIADDVKDHHTAQVFTAFVEEKKIFKTIL